MNKYFKIMMIMKLALSFISFPAISAAGTYYAGAKCCNASWDSAASQLMDNIAAL